MTNIQDLENIFANKVAVTHPSVSLESCRFGLVDIEPVHPWIATGEMNADGTPKKSMDKNAFMYDETQMRIKCEISLSITDANGRSTANDIPLVDRTHYFEFDKVRKLVDAIGTEVQLKQPRIEFRSRGERNDNFGRVETKMFFMFDGIEI